MVQRILSRHDRLCEALSMRICEERIDWDQEPTLKVISHE
jgi:hypothetical protein